LVFINDRKNFSKMSYKGKYTPKNKEKYVGDPSNVIYRSLWERQTFKWLDYNDDVKGWGSETIVIPYICQTDSRRHRYFVDLFIEFKNGDKYIIEIKPEAQTKLPRKPEKSKRKSKYIAESLKYIKNQSKWEAAQQFADSRGWIFEVWTEKTLRGLGIKIQRN
jgi:hypothetical protein